MTSNCTSNPGGVAKTQCLSLMHEAQRYFQLLNHTFGSTVNLNFSLVLFTIFHLLQSPLTPTKTKRAGMLKKITPNGHKYEDILKITFILIPSILFSWMCGGVELNKLLIDWWCIANVWFISWPKCMILNAASECFLMILVSNTRMKQSEKWGNANS